MLDTYLNLESALSAIHSNYLVCLGEFWRIVGIIFGGLVVWVGLVLARFVLNGCTFRAKRGRR